MLYFVSGDDSYNKKQYIEEKSKDKEQIRIDMNSIDYSELMSDIRSVDLFDEPKIYILDGFKGFCNKSEKYSKANTALLDQVFSTDEEIMIIADKKINRETSWYSKFGSGMEVKDFVLENLNFDEALDKFITEHQITISEEALDLVKCNFPNNIFGATNDLKKIWEYTDHQEIDEKSVKLAGQILTEHKIFELYNHIVSKQTNQAIQYLELLRSEGITDSDILLVSFTQIKRMYETKILIAKGYNDFKIASQTGSNPYTIKQNRKMLAHVSEKRLEFLVQTLADFDFQFKSGANTPENLVNMLVIS